MPRARTRRLAPVVVVVLTALTAGCVGIPTTGPIGTGEVVVSEPGSVFPLANAPSQGAEPEEIVGGFLNAVAAGPNDEYAVAREYLTLTASAGWDPRARVVVYEGADPQIQLQEGGTVLVSVPVAATLDEGGRYTEAAPGSVQEVAFELQRDSSDQWRISGLEDGVLIAAPTFDQVYRSTPVYFADPDRRHLVPDVRWFPLRNQATSAVQALLAGPSPWLRDAVVTGVPEGARISTTAVTVDDGVARVDVGSAARLAAADDRALLQAQLDATLSRLPGVVVDRVQLLIAGVPADTPVASALQRDPAPATGPVVLQGETLSRFDGGELVPLPGVPPLGPTTTSPALGTDRSLVALEGGSAVVRVPDDGTPPVPLLQGANLVPPTVDRLGVVWSGERISGGLLRAVPVAGGEPVDVAADWLLDRVVLALRVSRDGTRVAVASTGADGHSLDVAAVVRAEDGTPRRLGAPVPLAPGLTEATDVAWVDEATVAVLGRSAQQSALTVHLVPVGGPSRSLPLVDDAVALAAGRGERGLVVLTAAGTLHMRQTQSWAVVAEGVRAVTYAG